MNTTVKRVAIVTILILIGIALFPLVMAAIIILSFVLALGDRGF